MLTSLNFLKVGKQFPPASEEERLSKYYKNKLIFEGKHEEVYADTFNRIKRIVNNFEDVISYSMTINFQKLISFKFADFTCGEFPKITCGDDNSIQQKAIDKIIENSKLKSRLYSSAVDLSRFGDTILNVFRNDEGNGEIGITQPNFYYKVVDPKNIDKVVNHILANTYEIETESKNIFSTSYYTKKYLYVQIHYKGYYEEFTCELNENNTIVRATETKRINTGLSDFAVVPIHSIMTSDNCYGMDDYTDLDGIISELEVRLSQISKILDKHAEPTMQGPRNAMSIENGQLVFKAGTYIPKDPEDSDVSYITWEAQLEANFKIVENLINMLSIVSEMGSTIFSTDMKVGIATAPSGTALRRMLTSALAKVGRTRIFLDEGLKKSIKLCSELGGNDVVNLKDEDINIHWRDGISNDPREEAEIMAIRTGNKSTLSQWSAIQRLDNLNDEDATKELEAIKQDEKDNNPLSNMNFDYGKETKEVDTE